MKEQGDQLKERVSEILKKLRADQEQQNSNKKLQESYENVSKRLQDSTISLTKLSCDSESEDTSNQNLLQPANECLQFQENKGLHKLNQGFQVDQQFNKLEDPQDNFLEDQNQPNPVSHNTTSRQLNVEFKGLSKKTISDGVHESVSVVAEKWYKKKSFSFGFQTIILWLSSIMKEDLSSIDNWHYKKQHCRMTMRPISLCFNEELHNHARTTPVSVSISISVFSIFLSFLHQYSSMSILLSNQIIEDKDKLKHWGLIRFNLGSDLGV
ncbi:hypothetical protein O6P43_026255 [Quillaja saponaria]|uniref:Uncharacterized protein n=1 Tax=Quillaja saponaria TaxID=32244 RepID=A0AAD7L243_QUISA|nr:hypothetical protein O6P43_026255 [Quillaja saponaria]